MKCPACEIGNLDIWISYQSVLTNDRVSVRCHDEADIARHLRPFAVVKYRAEPYRQCSICQHKVELTGALI